MSKPNLTKEDIIKQINKNIGFSKALSSKLVEDILKILVNLMKNSNNVKITDFGTFKIKKKGERIGRNPKTREIAKISSRVVVTFRPSKSFREKVNLSKNND